MPAKLCNLATAAVLLVALAAAPITRPATAPGVPPTLTGCSGKGIESYGIRHDILGTWMGRSPRKNLEDGNWMASEESGLPAWRRAVPLIREGFKSAAAPGQRLEVVWCANGSDPDPEPFYPGDGFVDVIGANIYGMVWGKTDPAAAQMLERVQHGRYTLARLAEFAEKHGKQTCLGEWGNVSPKGAVDSDDLRGAGDCPAYTHAVYDWAARCRFGCRYVCYFNIEAGGGRPHAGRHAGVAGAAEGAGGGGKAVAAAEWGDHPRPSSTTAWAATASPRPISPQPSFVPAFTFTGPFSSDLSVSRIAGLKGASFGRSARIITSAFASDHPAAIASAHTCSTNVRLGAPLHLGSVLAKRSPMSPPPRAPKIASTKACSTTSPSEWATGEISSLTTTPARVSFPPGCRRCRS